jgi:hypothetical protein
MVETVIAKLRRLWWLLALLALPTAVFAHRLDEYLQATIVAVEPGGIRLKLNLTPGVAIADKVLALLDTHHDGVISTNEAAAYVELLKHDLTARLDGRIVELKLIDSSFPEPAELRAGVGIIQLEFSVTPDTFAAGRHQFTLENRHLPAMSVYLFNAARPESATVQIAGQKRNENQSTGEITFDFHPPRNPLKIVGILVFLAALSVVLTCGGRHVRQN